MRIGLGYNESFAPAPGTAVTGSQCPSLEQLQGIEDLNDPCQSGFSSLPLSTPLPINPLTGQTVPAVTVPASTTLSISWAWIAGGLAILGLFLVIGVRR